MHCNNFTRRAFPLCGSVQRQKLDIDGHLRFGGLLACETAYPWEAATQARLETKRCAEH